MILLRTAQYSEKVPVNKLVNDWGKLKQQLGTIIVTGPNANASVDINGKSVAVRPLLDQAISLIRPKLIEHGVKEIDTSPLPVGIQGQMVSSEPGKIHVDVNKITSYVQNSAQPPITQTDGTEVDDDQESHYISVIARELLGTIAHESKHSGDMLNEFEQYENNPSEGGPAFNRVQEAPGPKFENQIRDTYKSYEFAKIKIFDLNKEGYTL